MKKKLFPPPPEIVQRARCYLALRVLRAYVDVMGQTSDRRFDELMDTIRRWLVECEALLERRPVSNRTDSEVIAKLEVVLSRIDCGPHKPPREQYTHWGAALLRPYPPRGCPGHVPGLVRKAYPPQERRRSHHEPLPVAVSLWGCPAPRGGA